jgi:hypothetical protein
MTKEQAIKHNTVVLNNVITSLIENHYVNPVEFMGNPRYAVEMISMYIDAANVAREIMNMPKLVLYNIQDMDEED